MKCNVMYCNVFKFKYHPHFPRISGLYNHPGSPGCRHSVCYALRGGKTTNGMSTSADVRRGRHCVPRKLTGYNVGNSEINLTWVGIVFKFIAPIKSEIKRTVFFGGYHINGTTWGYMPATSKDCMTSVQNMWFDGFQNRKNGILLFFLNINKNICINKLNEQILNKYKYTNK